ncbi:hypothetical protein B0H13DRAFT_2297998, partial [Mycena leptocephala]
MLLVSQWLHLRPRWRRYPSMSFVWTVCVCSVVSAQFLRYLVLCEQDNGATGIPAVRPCVAHFMGFGSESGQTADINPGEAFTSISKYFVHVLQQPKQGQLCAPEFHIDLVQQLLTPLIRCQLLLFLCTAVAARIKYDFKKTRVSALENCRDFTIQGGTFNVSSSVEQSSGNFRVVKLGDLNLLDEIDKHNVVEWRPVHRKKTGVVVRHVKVIVGARRIYRARIFRSQDPMTAVVYNDAQFEQASHNLHRMVEVHRGQQFRHPHLAQFFGLGCSASMNALIYHDVSLKPAFILPHVQTQHFNLTIIKVAHSYWEETTGEKFYSLPGTAWIRLSTGKLHCEARGTFKLPEVKLTEYDLGDKLLSTLELNEFYSMVAYSHSPFPTFASSTAESIPFPSICNAYGDHIHSKRDQFCAIPTAKHLTHNDLYIDLWHTSDLPLEVLPTGWTRVDYSECHS